MARARARFGLLAAALLGSTGSIACAGPHPDDGDGSPRLLWSEAWGTPGDDFARAVAVTASGAVLAAGYSDGTFEGASSAGAWDAFVTRWNPDGERAWTTEWGSDAPEFAQAVVVADDERAFVAGYTPGNIDDQRGLGGHDAFLSELGADGGYGWTKQWGTEADDYVYAAARASAGVVVVGYTKGAFPGFYNAGEADAFVTLCDGSGAQLWSIQLGTPGTDYAQAVHVDASGRILVAGYTAGKLGEDADAGAEDAFLLALDERGDALWLRQWGSDTTDYALAVSSDASGGVYVAGYTYGAMGDASALGGEDAYVTKLDPDGALLWTRQLGTTSRDSARFVSVGADGSVFVGGDTEGAFAGEAAGGRDAFLVRFDQDGAETWRAQWGGLASEFSLAAAADGAGRALYVVGYVESSAGVRDASLSKWWF